MIDANVVTEVLVKVAVEVAAKVVSLKFAGAAWGGGCFGLVTASGMEMSTGVACVGNRRSDVISGIGGACADGGGAS